MIHSYPSIFNLGHKAVTDLMLDPVLIEEKVDGSQFSFGLYSAKACDHGYDPCTDACAKELQLRCRSKGAELQMLAPEKMFLLAVDTVRRLASKLILNWTYRAEYLQKPKHNVINYDRVPNDNIIIFDINTSQESYLSWEAKAIEAERLGLETVPRLFYGMVETPEMFRELLSTKSVLGGSEVEGLVVKNYARFGIDKKVLMGKFVSEKFKEIHSLEWKGLNPNQGDILEKLSMMYKSPARWAKAVQHLRDDGKLEDAPKDIGLLFREVPKDIEKECTDEIKKALFDWAWPRIQRASTAGLAEWYKERLLERQFALDPATVQTQEQVQAAVDAGGFDGHPDDAPGDDGKEQGGEA